MNYRKRRYDMESTVFHFDLPSMLKRSKSILYCVIRTEVEVIH